MSAGSLPAMYGGVSIAISYAKHPAHQHNPHAWHGRAKQNEAVAEAELRLKYQEQVLERLRTDPAYVEKVIRRKLGYARPEEYVFRFEN